MKQIRYIAKAYSEKIEEDMKISDVAAFIQGRYFVDAILCTVGNMLGGKKVKYEYPVQAYSLSVEETELSEDEIENQRQQFIASLMTMQHNFELNQNQNQNQKQEQQVNV